MGRSICIVSPGHVASNPRVVKEADALHSAGYSVTVVAGNQTAAVRPFDEEIIAQVPWTVVRIGASSPSTRLVSRLAFATVRASRLPASRLPPRLAVVAYNSQTAALTRAACAVPADLYIAHYVAALSAAAAAARRQHAALGYDAEDFHAGEQADQAGIIQTIEGAFLPSCSHLTAAAPMIADAYGELYGRKPITVLNVFPPAAANDRPIPGGRPGSELSAYWFSQSIGLDRGLQSFIEAMALTRARVTLHIRGSDERGAGQALLALAHRLKIGDRIELLPMASPLDMVELARGYDVGLSLETDVSESRRRCLTNKIFTYLMAGRPVVLSDTPAQKALAADLGGAAALVSLSDPVTIARQLDAWALSPERLQAAAKTAWHLACSRYNWQVEQAVFLASVERALEGRGKKSCRPSRSAAR
jgi:glycosyltransferase involved in cell wall biosynthesis